MGVLFAGEFMRLWDSDLRDGKMGHGWQDLRMAAAYVRPAPTLQGFLIWSLWSYLDRHGHEISVLALIGIPSGLELPPDCGQVD